MSAAAWGQLALLVALLAASIVPLGRYMARVFNTDQPAPGDRLFAPLERTVYRATGVDPAREQRWSTYALSVLAFSLVSVLLLYLLQRVQSVLPLNPGGFAGVAPDQAFNTATSFVTNTNWQSYAGETTMSHLVQSAGLAVQNFVSAAVGIAVAVALIRGLTRRQAETIGNFWVDVTRATVRVLIPLSIVAALFFVTQGIVQNFSGGTDVATVEGGTQHVPGGPVASQEAIKELGTNGGGFYNANAAHPFENPNALTNLAQLYLILLIPFSLPITFGRMANDPKQGWALLGAMALLWVGSAVLAMALESGGNPRLAATGADQQITATSPGGNMEGKEVRFGPASSGLYAATTTATSTGSVNSFHDSYTPLGGAVPLVNILLGEVTPGGVGSGLYTMLIFALLAVFIAGLMVGRTPEYLGKKIEATEMKLVVIVLLIVPLAMLALTAASVVLDTALASRQDTGPHGLTEIAYAFASGANNNGSAFAGLNANTAWFNISIGLAMLVGRFGIIVPVLAIAGSLATKNVVPASPGTFPTGSVTFSGLVIAIVLIVVGLTYFPLLSLGPVVEHLSG